MNVFVVKNTMPLSINSFKQLENFSLNCTFTGKTSVVQMQLISWTVTRKKFQLSTMIFKVLVSLSWVVSLELWISLVKNWQTKFTFAMVVVLLVLVSQTVFTLKWLLKDFLQKKLTNVSSWSINKVFCLTIWKIWRQLKNHLLKNVLTSKVKAIWPVFLKWSKQ